MAERRPKRTTLAQEIHKRRPFERADQEAFLNILRTATWLGAEFDRLFKQHDLSGATFNVLRILRGAGAEGRACHEIADHMVTPVPDVTRLVDRLEKRGLVSRMRGESDRRVVTVRILPPGLALLNTLEAPVMALHQRQLGHMSRRELATLSELLVKARHPDGEPRDGSS